MALTFGFGHVPAEHYRRHVDLVLHAEDIGFDYAWIPDQTFYRDPYVILTALALETRKIKLGLGVTNPYTRHPAMAGRAIATVAECAEGRVALGVGAGNVRELLRPLGIPFERPASRCKEMVQLVRFELDENSAADTFVGDFYKMEGAHLEFGVGARVPVYLAGRGPRVLHAAGEVADGVLIGGLCSPAGITYALDCVRRGGVAAGRDVTGMDIASWVTVILTNDRKAALDRVRPMVAHIIAGAPYSTLEAIGIPSKSSDALKADYGRNGSTGAAQHVTEKFVDHFAIVGEAAFVVERIRALEAAGVTQFVFLMPPGRVGEHQNLIEHLADAVLPALR